MAVSVLPQGIDPLTLRNGQHRVKALLSVLEEQAALAVAAAVDLNGQPIVLPAADVSANLAIVRWAVLINAELFLVS